DRARHARLDVAEGAGAGAGVAQDHHRGVLLGPALADVRAGRLLTHSVEVEAAHHRPGLGETDAGRSLDPDPVRLALAFRAGERRDLVHERQIATAARPCRSEERRVGKECRSRWWWYQ